MDNLEQEQEQEQVKASFEFHKNNKSNDYKFLIQRLKSISESIYCLEKNFFDKEA